mmetsp:Transcript_14440/g.32386  ORF Transcript_14440/g.32386 Transcript_14440/m.32386 type:complete len:95 (-) Transcript_14440:2713-2997(-)
MGYGLETHVCEWDEPLLDAGASWFEGSSPVWHHMHELELKHRVGAPLRPSVEIHAIAAWAAVAAAASAAAAAAAASAAVQVVLAWQPVFRGQSH